MIMNSFIQLVCQSHKRNLYAKNEHLICDSGCSYPILNGIPRFVPITNYSSSFGLQWNTFRTTQLDSHTGLTISCDRLTRIAGGTLDVFRGKTILEAGCGAGRFTELMLQAGANVFAIDLSHAVDANYENCSGSEHYCVAQADIMELPVAPEQFDIVVCIGVIQHTPDPEATICTLCSHVKPGGMLLIDHYAQNYPATPVRRWLRSFLLTKQADYSMRYVKRLVNLLWPLHKAFYNYRDKPVFRKLRPRFLYWSPIVDYHDAYGQLGSQLLSEWAVLDTHDTLTDRYKHLRSVEEIQAALRSFGMVNIEAVYAGNGVEARAWKPER
jgi:2-polyprenyl-3-methyl-5-hydroxy-6-metoxy-1,4-benzoquinol methylase